LTWRAPFPPIIARLVWPASENEAKGIKAIAPLTPLEKLRLGRRHGRKQRPAYERGRQDGERERGVRSSQLAYLRRHQTSPCLWTGEPERPASAIGQ
jgi:hypothetical protein